ncbi:PREDICTED: cytochrome c oxidase assembly protein COX11, mitochondrial-like [Brassica oleracea var. oleracea]|uniref:cytochrome c oxidase assembly protein COX11, mitochondrial-like n=1 Tax=Brassica oleracea var. oleracea TaxID=109376 RepID=UPI0006A74FAD|nr:PREDICTED: cytochrome c oxidase assembly protein COX11, mitochondrial-like [Brassica oleracea var. oleracea]
MRVKPGESALAFYTAENSSAPITGVSTCNVTPMKACAGNISTRYIVFSLGSSDVFFYVDLEFETDPRMDGINNLILSYTFFIVSEKNTNSSVPVQETN